MPIIQLTYIDMHLPEGVASNFFSDTVAKKSGYMVVPTGDEMVIEFANRPDSDDPMLIRVGGPKIWLYPGQTVKLSVPSSVGTEIEIEQWTYLAMDPSKVSIAMVNDWANGEPDYSSQVRQLSEYLRFVDSL